ncbi:MULTISPECIES: OprD family porin [unclassified Pseudomonas]|uniref:OprD family porin n=2 Tax=Pseudomonas TaxID=286 RepID=UPI003A0FBD95
MKNSASVIGMMVSAAVAGSFCEVARADESAFFKDSTATLQARNYYFSRDYSGIVGPNKQSKAEEWAQGFILNIKSGYTEGPVGFGVDALGLLGIKLDSSPDRVKTGLLPLHTDGSSADEYGSLAGALKMKVGKTELRVGELQPNLPVLAFSDIRLLPPTYQGASVVSTDIEGLTLNAGQLRSTNLRDSSNDQPMYALINDPINPRRIANITSNRFNYAGADYTFNDKRTTVGIWQAQLKDIYQQRFYNLKHIEPFGSWKLGANLGFYDAQDDGQSKAGSLDNRAFYSLMSAAHGGNTFYVGYQAINGKDGFLRIGDNISPLGNEVPTYEFAAPKERSWQLRDEYNFAAIGLPGLVVGARYLKGDNVNTGRGFEGKDWERDLDIGYVIQSGPFRDVGVRIRNATARSNYRTDIDENRLILSYTIKLF